MGKYTYDLSYTIMELKMILVKTRKDGQERLSNNFTVAEFACRDGSDRILIDTALVELLQNIRDHFGKPVNINSGYRTPSYDRVVGGTGSGMHTKGQAADICIIGIDPSEIAYYAQSILTGHGGVECGCYESNGYVHVDTRVSRWRAVKAYSNKTYVTVTTLFPIVKYGSKSQVVTMLQRKLNSLGYACGIADGECGKNTITALKKYQTDNKLTVDGIAGTNTYKSLYNKI